VWLVDSLYAPTPVSAALHGGIVNGGGILIITQLGVVSQSAVAVIVLASVAAIAIVVGVVASLVRTDVKGRLVMSTIAQMGFMLLIAALGLIAAALLHLIAHGFYKSALFLTSSDGIDRRAADRRAPRPAALSVGAHRLRLVAGAVVPVAALVVAAAAMYPGSRGLGELVVVIVLAGAFGAAGARLAVLMPTVTRSIAAVVGAAGAAVGFVIVTSMLTGAIANSPAGSSAAFIAGRDVAIAIAFLTLVTLFVLAALRRWAPTSAPALTVLAWGHSVGAPRLRSRHSRESALRRSADTTSAPHAASHPMGLAV
jgi:NAD(P)H-quinone oxidoreductase subunit 5